MLELEQGFSQQQTTIFRHLAEAEVVQERDKKAAVAPTESATWGSWIGSMFTGPDVRFNCHGLGADWCRLPWS